MVTCVRNISLTYLLTAKGSPSPSSSSFPSGSSLTKSHNLSKISIEINKNNHLLSSEKTIWGVGGGGWTQGSLLKLKQIRKQKKTKDEKWRRNFQLTRSNTFIFQMSIFVFTLCTLWGSSIWFPSRDKMSHLNLLRGGTGTEQSGAFISGWHDSLF